MNDTPTPLTDALHERRKEECRDMLSQYFEMTCFARQLEREIAEAREKLENAADRIEELWNALNKFYEVNTRFGIGGFGMMEYQKANHDARSVLFPQNAEGMARELAAQDSESPTKQNG
jgi:predicted RNase H-like nuclease (RuvC/YqgF family)